MSELGDKIATLDAAVESASVRIQEDVATWEAERKRLQDLIDAGIGSPEDLVALDAVIQKINALDPTKPAVLPE
jgi:multidrug resistance efflux pump